MKAGYSCTGDTDVNNATCTSIAGPFRSKLNSSRQSPAARLHSHYCWKVGYIAQELADLKPRTLPQAWSTNPPACLCFRSRALDRQRYVQPRWCCTENTCLEWQDTHLRVTDDRRLEISRVVVQIPEDTRNQGDALGNLDSSKTSSEMVNAISIMILWARSILQRGSPVA